MDNQTFFKRHFYRVIIDLKDQIEEDELLFALKNGFNIDSTEYLGETLLMYCCASNNEYVIKKNIELLFKYGADVNILNENGQDALMIFCENNEEDPKNIVSLLLKYGANANLVDKHNYSTLMWSCGYGNKKIIKLLLEYGADKTIKNDRGQTALDVARKEGFDDVVKLLE